MATGTSSSTGDTILLGSRKGLITLERDRSGRWRTAGHAFLGVPISYAMRDPRTDTLWACQDHDHWGCKLQRSRDHGRTWEEVPAPKYPEGEVIKSSFMDLAPGKPDKPATLKYLWAFEAGAESQPGRLYAGTEPGGLFVSDDDGRTWALNRPLWDHPSRLEGQWFGGGRDHAGIHSIVIHPKDPNRIYVGISCAGTFETTDCGRTWAVRNQGLTATFLPNPQQEVGHDPHLVAACRARPEVMWQQNHCGIFRTEDGGKNWTEVSQKGGPAFFGFAIAADPEDARTAWVVPAKADECRVAIDGKLCVSRTTDGGRTWQDLRNGLPQENCYDVVFRHGLAQRGDTLIFGSTTGNVFVSEDRGDSWSCVGSNFPQIYSVRFA